MFALMDLGLALTYVVAAIFAALCGLHPAFAIAFLISYYLVCSLNFHQIINLMKVDVSGYNSAIKRTISLHLYSILVFSIVYFNLKENISNLNNYMDAVYFSSSMWTTLGFEQITPQSYMRLIAVSQAFSGLVHFAIFISMYWFYAQSAMEGASRRSFTNTEPPIRLKQNRMFGFMELVDENNNSITIDAGRYDCRECKRCGSKKLLIREYYNWHHEIVHIPNFVVTCNECSSVGPNRHNAVLAVNAWNKSKPHPATPLRNSDHDGGASFEGDFVMEEIRPDSNGENSRSIKTSGGWRLAEPIKFTLGKLPSGNAKTPSTRKGGDSSRPTGKPD